MNRLPRILPVLFIVALVAFLAALAHLLVLRYESASAYPPYSSLRSDPLGTRVFRDSLESLADFRVRQHTDSFVKLADGRDTTLFMIGASVSKDPRTEVEAVERFVSEGGRLVIAFRAGKNPAQRKTSPSGSPNEEAPGDKKDVKDVPPTEGESSDDDREAEEAEEEDAKHGEEEAEDDQKRGPLTSIDERWGFKSSYARLPGAADNRIGKVEASRAESAPGLPPVPALPPASELPQTLPWHSSLYFANPADVWKSIYKYEERTLVMERSWGHGTIILLSDSYLLSNEAMSKNRFPALLAWLVGPSSSVIFDEAHLGIIEQRTILSLATEHGLLGSLGVLLLLAGLFIWRNAASLIPRRDPTSEEEADAAVRQRDHHAGLVNLLRRAVPESELVSVCLAEWLRTYPQDETTIARKREELLAAFKTERRTPVEAYRDLCNALTASEHHHRHSREKETNS